MRQARQESGARHRGRASLLGGLLQPLLLDGVHQLVSQIWGHGFSRRIKYMREAYIFEAPPRDRAGRRVALGLAVALALGAAAMAPGLVDAQPTPVLGSVWAPNQQGFGLAHPSHIYAGGDPTSVVKHIHWHRWGAWRATAHRAIAFWVPQEGSVADRHFARATVVASHLGTCKGRRAYRKIEWWFPGEGGRRAGVYGFGPDEMCGG
jgi:hypothetical protein